MPFFDFGPKSRNQDHFIILKNSENSESGVRLTIPYQMEPYGQQNGTFLALFGQKWLFLQLGAALNHFSVLIFNGWEQPQV